MLLILIFWNIAVFLLYGYDKFMAVKGGFRISEKTLLLTALFAGGIGAYLGMKAFRHKTKHTYFKIIVPLCAILTVMVFAGLRSI